MTLVLLSMRTDIWEASFFLTSPCKGEVGAPAPGEGPATSSELVGSRQNRLAHARQILRNVVVPKPELGNAAAAQPCAASLVPNLLGTFAVLAAIKLDR